MSAHNDDVVFTSKTQHYLKVKKPLLERQRRARINKCLDALKLLVAEFQSDDAIMRMDKAEMLESTIAFMRTTTHLTAGATKKINTSTPPMDSFRNGYMNAVNEVSRVMASTPGMSVQVGKSVMTHLGCEFNRLLQYGAGSSLALLPVAAVQPAVQPIYVNTRTTITTSCAPMSSPASSGYHSDCDENSLASPVLAVAPVWRPW